MEFVTCLYRGNCKASLLCYTVVRVHRVDSAMLYPVVPRPDMPHCPRQRHRRTPLERRAGGAKGGEGVERMRGRHSGTTQERSRGYFFLNWNFLKREDTAQQRTHSAVSGRQDRGVEGGGVVAVRRCRG